MKLSLIIALMILVASPRQGVAQESNQMRQEPIVEPIVGYRVDSTGVSFQLNSGGCTLPSDFAAKVDRSRENLARVTLYRLKPDTCHPFIPTAFESHFTFDELGIRRTESFTIINPNGIALGWLW